MLPDEAAYDIPDEIIKVVLARFVEAEVRLKLLPFVATPGITYNYRVAFEDDTGEVIREETVPVFVDAEQQDAQRALGERVIEGETVSTKPDTDALWTMIDAEDDLRAVVDLYVSGRMNEIKADLSADRHEETTRELENLDEYAQAERERIESFIKGYERKAEAGSDMDIAIAGQRERLEKLEERIGRRREELQRREQVISLAPEVENYCLTLPL